MNIAEEIFQRAKPDSIAVIERNVSYSYADLRRLSAEVTRTLQEVHGVRTTARIGLKCPDGMNYILLSLGILRASACFVPIAPEISTAECASLVETLHLAGVITGAEEPGCFSYEAIEEGGECPWQKDFEHLNPALIRFSSGTTGESKGILLSHETLHLRIMAANAGLQISPDDRILWVLSMAHHFVVSILLYLRNGATIVIPSSHLAGDSLSAASEHRATVLYASPFHYVLLSTAEERIPWPSLRLAVSTTAALPSPIAEDFAAVFGVYPVQALGVMEVGLPFINSLDAEKCPFSIGRPQPGFEVLLLDDTGKEVAPGNPGELFLKGPGMLDAYIAPWKMRRDILKDGEWFSTGDIASADTEGCYFLQGRTKTVINVGGMKFFPEEVESLLCSHPGISDARVMGRSHPTFGCIPVAEVVASEHPKVSPLQLTLLCKKQLARHKIPVEFCFVEKIPRTPSGKIMRR